MSKIKIRINQNTLLFNNTGHFSVFLSINNMNAFFAVYPDLKLIGNEHINSLESHLYFLVTEKVKLLFHNRCDFNLFDKYDFFVNANDIIKENIIFNKNDIELTLEITQVLYENLENKIKKYQSIKDTFEKVTTFLMELNPSQINNNFGIIRICFNVLKNCINSSIDKKYQSTELDYIKSKFLANRLNYKEIVSAKNKLYNISFPEIYYQEPTVPNKLENVF